MKKDVFFLLSLIIFCLLVRLWGIDKESVWWDEYTSLMHLNSGGIDKFLYFLPVFDPAVFPLYYIMEYFVWNYVGSSVILLRIVSVLLSVSVVLLIYLVGEELGSRRAGLFACLLYVLSPIYRFHSQGVRTYVLFFLLAVFSVWLLLRYIRTLSVRELILLSMSNLLLTLTHPFAFLVVLMEMVCIVLFWGGEPKKSKGSIVFEKTRFFVFQILSMIPAGILLLRLRYFSQETSGWFRLPTFGELLFDIFADDGVSWGYQVRTFEFSNVKLDFLFQRLNVLLDIFLLLIFIFLFLKVLMGLIYERKRLFQLSLLSSLVVFPPLLLYLCSVLYRPCIFPRYTLYGAIFMYLLAGIALEGEGQKCRRAIKYLIVFLFFLQLAVTVPTVQRTNWKECVNYISQNSRREGKYPLVLVYKDINRDVFRFNAGEKDFIVSYVDKVEDFIPMLGCIFRNGECAFNKVFFVYVSNYFGEPELPDFEAKLAELRINYEKRDLEGIEKIRVYSFEMFPKTDLIGNGDRLCDNEVWQNLKEVRFDLLLALFERNHSCGERIAEELASEDPIWELALRELLIGVGGNNEELKNRVLVSLRDYQLSKRIIWSKEHSDYYLCRAVEKNPLLELSAGCLDAVMESSKGNMEYARNKVLYLEKKFSTEPLPKILLGNIAMLDGNWEEAKLWYYSAVETGVGAFEEWKQMLDYIFVYKDHKKALEEYYRLKNEGVFVESGFEEVLSKIITSGSVEDNKENIEKDR